MPEQAHGGDTVDDTGKAHRDQHRDGGKQDVEHRHRLDAGTGKKDRRARRVEKRLRRGQACREQAEMQ